MQNYFNNVDYMLEGGQHYFGMESFEYPCQMTMNNGIS